MKDVRADLRRIGFPFLLPVAVDLPLRTAGAISVLLAPTIDRLVCGANEAIRAVERHRRHRSRRRRRRNDLGGFGKGDVKLDAGFGVDHAVPVDRDVPPATNVLCAEVLPHPATARRHELRDLGLRYPSPDDRQQPAFNRFDPYCRQRHCYAEGVWARSASNFATNRFDSASRSTSTAVISTICSIRSKRCMISSFGIALI